METEMEKGKARMRLSTDNIVEHRGWIRAACGA
jgi:hypothetical protein